MKAIPTPVILPHPSLEPIGERRPTNVRITTFGDDVRNWGQSKEERDSEAVKASDRSLYEAIRGGVIALVDGDLKEDEFNRVARRIQLTAFEMLRRLNPQEQYVVIEQRYCEPEF